MRMRGNDRSASQRSSRAQYVVLPTRAPATVWIRTQHRAAASLFGRGGKFKQQDPPSSGTRLYAGTGHCVASDAASRRGESEHLRHSARIFARRGARHRGAGRAAPPSTPPPAAPPPPARRPAAGPPAGPPSRFESPSPSPGIREHLRSGRPLRDTCLVKRGGQAGRGGGVSRSEKTRSCRAGRLEPASPLERGRVRVHQLTVAWERCR